ncbi:MAG: alpha/beta hydrolase [Microthrixaceae bacterium]|nr:alpha/beta hydrolase [Microthrixaceae bacterium]
MAFPDDPSPARPRSRRLLLLAMTALVTVALVTACAESSGDDGGAREVERRYRLYHGADPVPDVAPGTLLRYQAIDTTIPEAQAWRILYASEGSDGERIAVSGMVVAPDLIPPARGFPVVAWAHPTAGTADQCAPSKEGPGTIIGARLLVQDGFLVAATDYEGLGTPGVHPYLDGVSAGNALIDAARAAAGLPGVDTAPATLFWGYSQGGQAAVFAAQQAADHAPDLDVRGTVAAAPAAGIRRLAGGQDGRPPLPGVALMMLGTWSVDRDLDAAAILGDEAAGLVPRLEETCEPNPLVADLSQPLVVEPPAVDVEPWSDLLVQSTPGRSAAAGPVLLVQGQRDRIVAPASTDRLFRRLCRTGSTVELRRFAERGHGVAIFARHEIELWLDHRRQGLEARDECAG